MACPECTRLLADYERLKGHHAVAVRQLRLEGHAVAVSRGTSEAHGDCEQSTDSRLILRRRSWNGTGELTAIPCGNDRTQAGTVEILLFILLNAWITIESVPHVCTSTCDYKIDLDAAAVALAEASRLLSVSIFSEPKWTVETQFVSVRIAWLELNRAISAYRDHFAEA